MRHNYEWMLAAILQVRWVCFNHLRLNPLDCCAQYFILIFVRGKLRKFASCQFLTHPLLRLIQFIIDFTYPPSWKKYFYSLFMFRLLTELCHKWWRHISRNMIFRATFETGNMKRSKLNYVPNCGPHVTCDLPPIHHTMTTFAVIWSVILVTMGSWLKLCTDHIKVTTRAQISLIGHQAFDNVVSHKT